jgi:preprotein translocase subunit SecF
MQMTITRLILLAMAVFLVVFAIRVFGSRFLK